jgi:hypothetical protein
MFWKRRFRNFKSVASAIASSLTLFAPLRNRTAICLRIVPSLKGRSTSILAQLLAQQADLQGCSQVDRTKTCQTYTLLKITQFNETECTGSLTVGYQETLTILAQTLEHSRIHLPFYIIEEVARRDGQTLRSKGSDSATRWRPSGIRLGA